MDFSFIIFVVIQLAILWLVRVFLRSAIVEIARQSGMHAKDNAKAYVKCSCLIMLSMISGFKEAFHALTSEVASRLAWWDWIILFTFPISSGLAVLAAFVDPGFASKAPPANQLQPQPENKTQ